MPFDALPRNTENALIELATKVSKQKPLDVFMQSFRTRQLQPRIEPVSLTEAVRSRAMLPGRYIYYFEADTDEATLLALHSEIATARKTKREQRAFSRLFAPSHVLYVGSSASLLSRFRQHLGYGPKAVYAMQLAFWANIRDVPVRFFAVMTDSEAC